MSKKAAVFVLGICAQILAAEPMEFGGGGPPDPVPCITRAERGRIAGQIADYDRSTGRLPRPIPQGAGDPFPPLPFYPMAGTLYEDLYINNFVDLNTGAGILDFDCRNFTYDGHDATDVDIRSFDYQEIGVPIFAATDGRVIAAHDGEFDMNTSCTGNANYVAIRDENNFDRVFYYLHMKTGSVAVQVGDYVFAGRQIGLTASSGCSTGPHLHFASYPDIGNVIEPFAGPCRPGPSGWVDQIPVRLDTYLRDLDITDQAIPNWPFDMPRTGTFVQGVRTIRFRTIIQNLPQSSQYQWGLIRPDGSTAYSTGIVPFNNPFYRWSWWWWGLSHNFNQIGTWILQLQVNGQVMANAPFEVVASPAEVVNRPPYPIDGLEFDPPDPVIQEVVFCRVDTSLVLDDPDYDIVRYEYVWKHNGYETRRVTSAALSDAIQRNPGWFGGTLECTVTPGDGAASEPSITAMVTIPCIDDLTNDCNSNGVPDTCDYDCNGNFVPDECEIALGTAPDCNGNGIFDTCESDCNASGLPDECDILGGTSADCNANDKPDECEPDCDANGVPNDCEIAGGTTSDCNADSVPDNCQLAGDDCDDNEVLDTCQSAAMISGHPQGVLLCPTDTAMFSVVAAPGSTYQWRKNGVPLSDGPRIDGAQSATLTVSGVETSDVGAYTCGVAQGCVSAGSNAAQLSLKTVATVTGDPVTSLTRCAGATASFSVTAMGTAPLSYEWRKGGAPMGAPNLATLFFANVHPADAGSYSCLVSNECGSDLSAAGSLIVRGEGFADEPDGQCASSGETVVFSAQATNVNGVTVFWSWYRNGMGLANDPPHITGAGTNTLTISNVTPADAADYSAVIITTSPTVCINESTPAPLLVDTCPECATPGDMDGDGDVDLRDMQQFALCYGSGAGLVPGCECADTASNSFDVNRDDWSEFEPLVTGP